MNSQLKQEAIQQLQQQSLQQWQSCAPAFRQHWVVSLKKELLQIVDGLRMPEQRKSYLLHQILQAREFPEILETVSLINEKQLLGPGINDLIYPTIEKGKAIWSIVADQSEPLQ